jgi:hypothetical protein
MKNFILWFIGFPMVAVIAVYALNKTSKKLRNLSAKTKVNIFMLIYALWIMTAFILFSM